MVKTSMFLIAVIFLAMGILYQMGILKFTLPSLNAQKGQQRGVSMHRGDRAATDALTRGVAYAGKPVYRAKLRPADQTNPLPETSAGQGGDASSFSAIAYAAPSARRE
jgi:Tfp pilus assembly protein PilV